MRARPHIAGVTRSVCSPEFQETDRKLTANRRGDNDFTLWQVSNGQACHCIEIYR